MVLIAYFLLRTLLLAEPVITEKAFIHANIDYSDWVCVKDTKGIALLVRWVKVNDSLNVRERRGEMIVNCNYQAAIDYLENSQTVGDWMQGVKTIKEIQLNGETLVYIIIQLPWPFSNRDLLGKYSTLKIDDKQCLIKIESEKDAELPESKSVRIEHYRASWALEKVSNRKTKITFTTFSSEPPMFPQWVQEPVLKKIFYRNLKKMRMELSKRNYLISSN